MCASLCSAYIPRITYTDALNDAQPAVQSTRNRRMGSPPLPPRCIFPYNTRTVPSCRIDATKYRCRERYSCSTKPLAHASFAKAGASREAKLLCGTTWWSVGAQIQNFFTGPLEDSPPGGRTEYMRFAWAPQIALFLAEYSHVKLINFVTGASLMYSTAPDRNF